MKQKILTLIILLALPLAFTACTKKGNAPTTTPPDQQQVGQLPTVNQKQVVADDPSTYPPEKFISLKGSDPKLKGGAYRSYVQGKFILNVGATLPNINADENYQVWLFQPNSKKFVPIGPLVQNDVKQGNNWGLQFSSDKELKEFSHLVITTGKNIIDPNTISPLLEGNF